MKDEGPRFSQPFDRALAACAQAQLLATRCRELQASARAAHASARRIRELARATRSAWVETDCLFEAMQHEVELVAHRMRDDGVERDEAAAAVRAHVRFVLYDGGLREQEAEAVVTKASEWVDRVYKVA